MDKVDLNFIDKGFSFTKPPDYSTGHRPVTKVVNKVPLMARFLGQASTSAQQEDSESDTDPDDPPHKESCQDDEAVDRVSHGEEDSDDSQKLIIDTLTICTTNFS